MYPIGFIQNITYTILAFQNKFYGEVAEQVFYIVTMIWGMVAWAHNMNINEDGTKEVKTRKFNWWQWALSIVTTGLATWGLGAFLAKVAYKKPMCAFVIASI